MPAARRPDGAVTAAEAAVLFDSLAAEAALVLAVSGGPDSTALLHLMARWRGSLRPAPRLVAVTVDHGLRPEARHEAEAVGRLAATLAVEHETVCWRGAKPATGIQEAARLARYSLLHAAARRAHARCVVTAHTLDDQAETVLFRLARGSGLSGIAAMAREVPLAVATGRPGSARAAAADGVVLVRPLLDVPKARLMVTLREAGIAWAEDPGNADPRFTRARLRSLMPALAGEGLTPQCLARLARRVRRSEAALEAFCGFAAARLGGAEAGPGVAKVVWNCAEWRLLPEEIALRLLGRAIASIGTEGPVEFGKLEALHEALAAAVAGGAPRFRRTLAGAMVSLKGERVIIDGAPARRGSASRGSGATSRP